MFTKSFSRAGAVAVVASLLLACGDAPSAPTPAPAAPNQSLIGGLLGTVVNTVNALTKLLLGTPLLRTTSLSSDITVTKSIGPAGGTITISQTGFRLIVPPNAVSKYTTFTVTAVKGNQIAYEFGPHGATFAVPLTFEQDLANTGFWNLPAGEKLTGGYFADRTQLNQTGGTATFSEPVPAATLITGATSGKAYFPIKHFSGYLIASGRTSTATTTAE